mmetsp:Transcript_35650/g.58180  ORF Transcript_35650/g.58180 Transcript_35650/m.58180 type:complete len:87 (-) Transcript_35650:786-1046(-)
MNAARATRGAAGCMCRPPDLATLAMAKITCEQSMSLLQQSVEPGSVPCGEEVCCHTTLRSASDMPAGELIFVVVVSGTSPVPCATQ